MNDIESIDTNIGIKLNNKYEISMVFYNYKNKINGEIDIILKISQEELKKVKDNKIDYKKTFEELNFKYKIEINKILNSNNNEKTNYITKIFNKISTIIPKIPFPRPLNIGKSEK